MEKIFFETEYWQIILAEDQTYFGRSVVVLKRSCEALSQITNEELLDFLGVVKKYERVFKSEYGAIMFNE